MRLRLVTLAVALLFQACSSPSDDARPRTTQISAQFPLVAPGEVEQDEGPGEAGEVALRQATGPVAPLLVIVDREGARVVLHDDPVEDLPAGAAELVARGDNLITVRRPLAAADLGPTGAWLGRTIRLFGRDGAVCEGIVARLSLEGRVAARLWDESSDHPEPTAEEAWELASSRGRAAIVAEIDASGAPESCQGAIWAQPSADAAPPIFAARPADEATGARALAALRALPRYAEIQGYYGTSDDRGALATDREEDDQEGSPTPDDEGSEWWDQIRGATTIWTTPATAAGDGQLVIVDALVEGGCHGFSGQITAIFRDDRGTLTLLNDPGNTEHFIPVGASDLDEDGQLDLLGESEIRRGAAFQIRHESAIPDFACDC
jgi:hypothetical protein